MAKVTKKSVTAQDVATHAGVSRAVVSRALSDNGSVAPATKEKVLKSAHDLGYQINYLAQGLNRKRTRLVGVVVTRLDDPFRAQMLQHLLLAIQQKGYQALVMEVRHQDQLQNTLREFIQYRVSGVIITSGQPPAELAKECTEMNVPVVTVNRLIEGAPIDNVCSDNDDAARQVLRYCHQHGITTLHWLNSHLSTWSGWDRGRALNEQKKQLKLDIALNEIKTESALYEAGFISGHHFVPNTYQTELVYAANSQLACGFLDGLRSRKAAHQHVHVIGFDDTFVTAQHAYQLSTFRQDITALADNALSLLLERGHNPQRAVQCLRIPVTLITRATTLNTN